MEEDPDGRCQNPLCQNLRENAKSLAANLRKQNECDEELRAIKQENKNLKVKVTSLDQITREQTNKLLGEQNLIKKFEADAALMQSELKQWKEKAEVFRKHAEEANNSIAKANEIRQKYDTLLQYAEKLDVNRSDIKKKYMTSVTIAQDSQKRAAELEKRLQTSKYHAENLRNELKGFKKYAPQVMRLVDALAQSKNFQDLPSNLKNDIEIFRRGDARIVFGSPVGTSSIDDSNPVVPEDVEESTSVPSQFSSSSAYDLNGLGLSLSDDEDVTSTASFSKQPEPPVSSERIVKPTAPARPANKTEKPPKTFVAPKVAPPPSAARTSPRKQPNQYPMPTLYTNRRYDFEQVNTAATARTSALLTRDQETEKILQNPKELITSTIHGRKGISVREQQAAMMKVDVKERVAKLKAENSKRSEKAPYEIAKPGGVDMKPAIPLIHNIQTMETDGLEIISTENDVENSTEPVEKSSIEVEAENGENMPQENGNNPGFEPEEAPSTSFMTPVKTQENPALSEESAISKESGLDQEVIGNNDGSNSSAFGLEMSPSPQKSLTSPVQKSPEKEIRAPEVAPENEASAQNVGKTVSALPVAIPAPEVEQTTEVTTKNDETAQLASADKEPETTPTSSSATTPAPRRGRPPRTTRKNDAAVKNNTAFGLDMSPSPQKIQTSTENSLEKESRMAEAAKTKETLTLPEEMNKADTATISEPGIERTSEKTTENDKVVPLASTEKEPETVPSSSSATTPAPRRGRPPRATPKNDPESSALNPLSEETEENITTKEDISVKGKKGPNTEAETTSSFIPPTTPAHRQGRLPKNTPKNVGGYGVSARGINSTNTLRNLGIPSEATKLPLSDDEDGSSSSDNEKALMKPAYLNISKTNVISEPRSSRSTRASFEGNPQKVQKPNSSTSASSGNRKSITPEAGKNTTISSQKASVQPSSSTSLKSRQPSESPSATSAKSTQVQNLRSTKKQTPPPVETPSMATRSRQASLTPSVSSVSSASKDLPSTTRKSRQSTDTTTPEPSKIVTRSRQSSEQQAPENRKDGKKSRQSSEQPLEGSSADSKEESIGARVNRRYSGHPTNDTTPLAETASRKRKCEDPPRKTPEPAPKSAARPNQRVKTQKPAENASGPPTRVSKMTAMRAPKRREKAAEDEDPKPVAETRSEEAVEEPDFHPQPTDSKRRKAHSKPGNVGNSKAKEDEMKNTEESKPVTRSKQVQPSKNVRLEAGSDEVPKSAGKSKPERKTRKQSEIEAAENLETDGLNDLEEEPSLATLEIETNEKSKPGSKSKSDAEKPTTEKTEIVRLQGGQDKDTTGKKSEIAPAEKSKRDKTTTPADLEIGAAAKSKSDTVESSKSAQLGKAQKAKQSESPSTENPKSPISSKNSSVDLVDHTEPIGSRSTSIDSEKSAEIPETPKEPQNNVSSEVSRPSTESRSEVPENSENFTFEMQEDEDDEDRLEIDEPEPIVQQKLPETKPQMVNSATEDVGLAVPEIDDDVAEMKPKVATTVKPPKAFHSSHDPSREEKKPAVNTSFFSTFNPLASLPRPAAVKKKNPAILAAIGLEISDSESDDEETSKLDVPKKEPKAEPVLDAVSASFALKKNQEKAVRKTVLLPDGQPAPKRGRLSGTAKKSPAGNSNTGQMMAAVKKRLSTGSKETAKKRTVSSAPAYAPRAKLRKLEMNSNIARGQLLQAFHMKSDPDVIKLQMGDNLKEVEKMPAKDVAEVMIEYLQHSSQSDMWRVVLRLKDTGNPDALTNTEEENFLSTAFSLPNCAGDIWLPFIKKLSSTMALQSNLSVSQCGAYIRVFCHAVNFCDIEENVKDEIVRDMLTMIFMNHENTAVAATVYFLLSSVFPRLRWIIEEIEEETCFATLFRSLLYRNKDHFEVISWLLRARFDYVHVLQLTSDETLKRLEAVEKKIEADFADPQKQDSILVISGKENSSVQAGTGLDKYLLDILVLSKTASNDALTFAFSRLKNLITEIENSIFDKDPAKDDSLFTVSAFRKQITQKQALAFFAKWDVIRVVLANFLVGHDVSSSNSVLDALRSIAPQIHEFQEKMKDDELKRVETLDTAGSSEKDNEPRRLVQMNVSRIANFIEAFTRYKV